MTCVCFLVGGLHDLCGTDCAVCWLFAMMLFWVCLLVLGLFALSSVALLSGCVVFEYADWIYLVVVGLLFWLGFWV